MPEYDSELAVEALRRAIDHLTPGDDPATVCAVAREFYAFLTNPASEAK